MTRTILNHEEMLQQKTVTPKITTDSTMMEFVKANPRCFSSEVSNKLIFSSANVGELLAQMPIDFYHREIPAEFKKAFTEKEWAQIASVFAQHGFCGVIEQTESLNDLEVPLITGLEQIRSLQTKFFQQGNPHLRLIRDGFTEYFTAISDSTLDECSSAAQVERVKAELVDFQVEYAGLMVEKMTAREKQVEIENIEEAKQSKIRNSISSAKDELMESLLKKMNPRMMMPQQTKEKL